MFAAFVVSVVAEAARPETEPAGIEADHFGFVLVPS